MGCTIRVSPLDYVLFAYPGTKILAGTSVHFFRQNDVRQNGNALGQTFSTLLRIKENLQEVY